MQKPAIAGGRNVVQIQISAHGRADARLDGRMKGLEIDILQKSFGEIGFVVIAAANSRAVAREMFHARENVIGRADVVALKTADLRGGHRRAEIRIFAGAFDDTAPAWIARDV